MSGPRRFGGLSTETKPTDFSVKPGAKFYEYDTLDIYTYDGNSWNQSGTSGAANVDATASLNTLLAGERNPGTSNDYLAAVPETNATVVNVADDETDVSSTVPALLFGVYVNTVLSAQVLPLKDGTGGTTIVTIPASAAAGSMYNFPGLKFNTALIVDPDNAATGNVTVAWRPQG